jgi:uncharacterized protein
MSISATQADLTTTTQNRELMQRIFAGLEQGDSRLFVESMAEDIRWIVTGTTRWSRAYQGKQAVLNELLAVLRSRVAGRIKTIADRFIAEGDVVAVECHGSNVTKAGKPYNNRYCWVCSFSGGKITELVEYMDTELVTSALADTGQ